ncbi:MAG: GGDEF domain-containing protein [Sphingomonadaceae bacterium]
MDQAVRFAKTEAFEEADATGLGHPELAWFDATRPIFVETGLSPEPQAYELFWMHVKGADPALSRDIERAIEEGRFTRDTIKDLRRTHLGEIAAAEVHEMVAAAQGSALRLAERLEGSREEVEIHDRAVIAEDNLLATQRVSPTEILGVIKRLRAANARVLAANRRLEADIERATRENASLIDRLETAERAARTDTLTGLLNRRGLLDMLRRAMAEATKLGRPLAIALVDIDHFKRINDEWGHSIGDEVLRYVGTFLVQCLKKVEGSFAGRFGGEEFVVVLPGLDTAQATRVLDSIRAALARQVVRRASDGATLGRIAFSAGVARLRPDQCAEALIDRADAAVYAAKRAGRDRVLPELPDLP